MTETPAQGTVSALNGWLKRVGESRDGILVVGGALYILGYIVWSVNAYLNGLGLLPAFESQYFIAGIVPLVIIYVVFYSIRFCWTNDLHLPGWLNVFQTRKWWGDTFKVLFFLLYLLYPFDFMVGNRSLRDILAGKLNYGAILASVAGVVFLLSIFSIDVRSKDPLKIKAGRTGKSLKDKFVVGLRLVIAVGFLFVMGTAALGFYVALLYSRLPQSLGGVRPRCAYLDVEKTGLSKDTLAAILPSSFDTGLTNAPPSPTNANSAPSAPASTAEITRSARVEVLFSGSEYSLIRVHGKVFEIKMDVIHAIESCD